MKLAVLGATGGIGMEVVRQAIAQDHQVTAFVRSPERLEEFGGRITVIAGDPLDPDQLARAICGHDAILSGFAPQQPPSKNDADLLARFAGSLTQAMLRDGLRRAVIVSTAF